MLGAQEVEEWMDKHLTSISKFLSYILRHRPDEIGIALDPNGWVPIADLLASLSAQGRTITRAELDEVVATNPKRRFAISEDGLRIRASQGHSIEIDLGYEPAVPPELLFHGTATRLLELIRRQGLVKGARHHVHLSADESTARAVGERHGQSVVLMVRSGAMARDGLVFYISANGVWLADAVPYKYIDEPGPAR